MVFFSISGVIGQEQCAAHAKSKEDDVESQQFIFSPTMKYIETITESSTFNYRRAKKKILFKLAFEIEIQPGSYKVGHPSVGEINSTPDLLFKLEETEWVTKERGNTVIKALLIRAYD